MLNALQKELYLLVAGVGDDAVVGGALGLAFEPRRARPRSRVEEEEAVIEVGENPNGGRGARQEAHGRHLGEYLARVCGAVVRPRDARATDATDGSTPEKCQIFL